ncbi:MAG TPA: APC family permease [Candidatus Binataceae bacterium]|nr:APC family permease [Candidatus Binataceae bacterium]
MSRSSGSRFGLWPLVSLIYLLVSGGAYGIEEAVGIAGPRLTLLLCTIIPITLSLPTALMAAELTALIPVEGGFYFWVKAGLGPFAGFAEAYLTILFTMVDSAIYPVLFATYLSFLLPIGPTTQTLLGVGLVWLCGLLNLLGIKTVGRTSIGFTSLLLLPMAALVLFGLPQFGHWSLPPEGPDGHHLLAALGGGMTVVMWNFGGWENVSVVAGEIETPGRNYVRAIAIALPMVALGYLLPLSVGLVADGRASNWHTGYFAEVGARIGGPWLKLAIGLGGAISAFGMFDAALLWVSRLPFVLAGEGYLPRGLGQIWKTSEVPARSIIVCCVVFSVLVSLGFMTLIVLDVAFYMMALMLEMWALVHLRYAQPDRKGLFTIGGGRMGLILTVGAPLLTWLATFGFAIAQGGGEYDYLVAITLALPGWPLYLFLRHRYGGPASEQR